MNNIIIVDRNLFFVNRILENPNNKIIILVVDNEQQDVETYRMHPRVKHIYTVAELDKMDSTRGIDFGFIRRCKGVQLKAENAMLRFEKDYAEKKYRYYMGLAFWRTIFEEQTIDTVFVSGPSHGFVYDGVLIGVALNYNVPAYSLNPIGVGGCYEFIFDHGNHAIVELKNKKTISDIGQYLVAGKYDVLHLPFDEDTVVDTSRMNLIKEYFREKTYRVFGYYGRALLVALTKGEVFEKKQICSSGFKVSLYNTLKSLYQIYTIRRFLDCNTERVDLSVKYIYYALHLEPEASTQTKTTLESQIIIIKMLSECLPTGWKIYVKEHPHQYKLNNNCLCYLAVNGELFKSKQFYERILSIPNVQLVSRNYDGKQLVKASQAVASMVGSVLLEAIPFKKPLLLFSEFHPFLYADSVLKCFSYDECMRQIQRLRDGYTPDYDDILPAMNRYVSSTDEDLRQNVVDLLQ